MEQTLTLQVNFVMQELPLNAVTLSDITIHLFIQTVTINTLMMNWVFDSRFNGYDGTGDFM